VLVNDSIKFEFAGSWHRLILGLYLDEKIIDARNDFEKQLDK
jgi:hypothetical protein